MTHYSESDNHRWTYHSWPITSGRFHSQPIIDGRHHTAVLAWGGGLKRTSLFSLKTFTDAHQNFTRHKCRLLITLSSLRLKKKITQLTLSIHIQYSHRAIVPAPPIKTLLGCQHFYRLEYLFRKYGVHLH